MSQVDEILERIENFENEFSSITFDISVSEQVMSLLEKYAELDLIGRLFDLGEWLRDQAVATTLASLSIIELKDEPIIKNAKQLKGISLKNFIDDTYEAFSLAQSSIEDTSFELLDTATKYEFAKLRRALPKLEAISEDERVALTEHLADYKELYKKLTGVVKLMSTYLDETLNIYK